jgi:hypothetical protein
MAVADTEGTGMGGTEGGSTIGRAERTSSARPRRAALGVGRAGKPINHTDAFGKIETK